MKMTTVTVAFAAMFAQSAQARVHHQQHVTHHEASRHFAHGEHHYPAQPRDRGSVQDAYAYAAPSDSRPGAQGHAGQGELHGGYGGRPAAWCGWEMRHLVSGDPGPAYNLARNWARWGRAGPAGVGAVVVWSHHVGKIVGQEGGMWVIESGNDGHRLRTRPRSIAGAIAIRWG
jgi:hypothetical protein